MLTAKYDAADTLTWMLGEAHAALAEPLVTSSPGTRPRHKAKALKQAEAIRFQTIAEALWNVAGRPAPLEQWVQELEARMAAPV